MSPSAVIWPRTKKAPSLAVVFWIYLVLIGRLVALVVANLLDEQASGFLLAVIFGGCYMLWAWLMAWQTADRFAGPTVWRIVAKTAVVVDVACFVFGAIVGFAVLTGLQGFWLG